MSRAYREEFARIMGANNKGLSLYFCLSLSLSQCQCQYTATSLQESQGQTTKVFTEIEIYKIFKAFLSSSTHLNIRSQCSRKALNSLHYVLRETLLLQQMMKQFLNNYLNQQVPTFLTKKSWSQRNGKKCETFVPFLKGQLKIPEYNNGMIW